MTVILVLVSALACSPWPAPALADDYKPLPEAPAAT